MGGPESTRSQINRIVSTTQDEWRNPSARFFAGDQVKPWILLNNAIVAGDESRGHRSIMQLADRGDDGARQAMMILMALRDLDVALHPETV